MNRIEVLVRQTQDAYGWTDKLINSIPQTQWDNVPDIVESSVSWQTGHLVVSLYFHSIMAMVGHQMDLLHKLPLRDYDSLFTNGHPKKAVGKVRPEQLRNHLTLMQQRSIAVIGDLAESELKVHCRQPKYRIPLPKINLKPLTGI